MANDSGIRLAGYDYSTPNFYFITTVIEGRRPLLGEVRAGVFSASRLGNLVLAAWDETLKARPWVSVDVLQVMPDHVHAIVGWNEVPSGRTATLGAFVGQFKGKASQLAHASELCPSWDRVWQSGFWDRVIRNQQELQKIRAYIQQNPARLLMRQQQLSESARRELREKRIARQP